MQKVAVVIPCFNEAGRLQAGAFVGYAEKNSAVSFIFVNDGSTDATLSIIKSMSEAAPDSIFYLSLDRNSGKAEAVRQGVLAAIEKGFDYIGFWDADLATPLDVISDFCAFLDGHPGVFAVLGSRVKLLGRRIDRRTARHFIGRVFATFASLILRLPVYDTQCGAKLFRRTTALRRIFSMPFRVRWTFDVEILARYILMHEGEGEIIEYPLQEWKDIAGSKVKIADTFRGAAELMLIALLLHVPFINKRYRAMFIKTG